VEKAKPYGMKKKVQAISKIQKKPSLSTILGISQAKRQLRKDLGLSVVHRPRKLLSYKKQSIKRKYIPFWDTEVGRLSRFLSKKMKGSKKQDD